MTPDYITYEVWTNNAEPDWDFEDWELYASADTLEEARRYAAQEVDAGVTGIRIECCHRTQVETWGAGE